MKQFLLVTAAVGLASFTVFQAEAASKMSCRVFSLTGMIPVIENFAMNVASVAPCASSNHSQQIAKTVWSVRTQFNAACEKPGKETDDFIGVISISSTDPAIETNARTSNLENDDALSRPKSQRLGMIATHAGARSHIQIDCKID